MVNVHNKIANYSNNQQLTEKGKTEIFDCTVMFAVKIKSVWHDCPFHPYSENIKCKSIIRGVFKGAKLLT